VGHDTQRALPRAASSDGVIVEHLLGGGAAGTSWVQWAHSNNPQSVRVGDSSPASGDWELTAIAIEQAGSMARAASIARVNAPTAGPVDQTAPEDSSAAERPMERAALMAVQQAVQPERTFGYNAEGDRTSEVSDGRERVLGYDQAGRLTSVGALATYAYNGDGLRTSKTVGGLTTAFTWDQAESLPVLLQAGNTSYIYGPSGEPIEQITNESATYILHDQQGSTRILTDDNGHVVGSYSYGAWGNVTSHTGNETTHLQYDGQYTDEETGYQYLRARYYDPSTGQFLTPDPAYATTLARYSFVEDDPVDTSDPTGLCSWVNPFCDAGETWHVTLGEHWRGAAQATVIGVGAVAAGACVAVTAGACAGALGTVAVTAGIGGATGAAVYGIGAGPHTLGGYASAVAFGAGGAAAGTLCAASDGAACWALIPLLGGAAGGAQYVTDTPSCDLSLSGLFGAGYGGVTQGVEGEVVH
jgi:RHS repeat-associated protein